MSHAADLPHVVIVGCGFAGLAATTGPERCSAAPSLLLALATCHSVGGGPVSPPGASEARAMPLQEELDRRHREVYDRLDPADRRVIEDEIERVRMLPVAETGLSVGDTLPDFVLLDAAGGIWRSEEPLTRGLFVLSFFRGAWCPYCDPAMRTLEAVRRVPPRAAWTRG